MGCSEKAVEARVRILVVLAYFLIGAAIALLGGS